MIIYGTRGLKSKVKSGEFYCPQCSRTQSYDRYKVRRWFTLYFIPLIPLKSAGVYLECQGCLGTFETDALNHGPEHYEAESRKFEAEFQKAMKGTMILTLLADGRIEPEELALIRDVYGQLTGENYVQETLMDDVQRFAATKTPIKGYLADIGGRLNDGGKAMVYKAAVLVAKADGEIAPEEDAHLKATYKALGLSRSQAKSMRSSIS